MPAPADETKTDQVGINEAQPAVGSDLNALNSMDDDDEDDDDEDEADELCDDDHTKVEHFGWEAMKLHVSLKNVKIIALLSSVVVYFLANAAVFCSLEGWTVDQALWFSVVVVTTVGYGDYLPKSEASKIATIILVLFGLSIVVLAWNIVADIFVSQALAKASSARRKTEGKTGLFDKKRQRWHKQQKAMWIALADFLFIAMGTFVFTLDLKNHEDSDSESHFLDGLYLTVITITTVGFGDLAPLSKGARCFACFLMLVGIPVQVTAFSVIADVIYPETEEPIKIRKIRGSFTPEKFEQIHDFVEDIRRECLRSHQGQGDETISRFEFLSFMLVHNGAISLKNVKTCMHNFAQIDATNKGFINKSDIGVHASHHHRHPVMSQTSLTNLALVDSSGGSALAEDDVSPPSSVWI